MTADGGAVDLAAAALERHAGLRFDASSRDRLARALAALAADAGRTPREQASALAPGTEAFAELQDRATLQETAWFRDPAWWDVLSGTLLPVAAARAAAAGRPLVLWSAGCANGQEAYSLAIACEEAGVPDYRVVATDVSRVAVARAQAGAYGERELRGLSSARRERWLRLVPGGHVVDERLRRRVDVSAGNLAHDRPPIADATCGLVLCRYVLIYLAPTAATTTLERFERALEPQGHLVIGAAESLWHLSDRFTLVPHAGAFTYQARREVDAAGPSRGRGAGGVRDETPRNRRASARTPTRPAAVAAAGAGPAVAAPAAGLTAAEAPAGRAPADAADPAALLREGEGALAGGDLARAAACFRGAAYLEPSDPIAHLQLGLVLERMDDPGAQRAFRAAWNALRSVDPATLDDSLGGYRAEELVRLVAAKLGVGA